MSPLCILAADAPADAGPIAVVVDWAVAHSAPLIVTGIALVAAVVVSTLVARRVTRPISDEVKRHKTRRTIAYLAQAIALVIIAVAWAGTLNIQLWIGLLSVGLALALQNAILCLAGWAYVTLRRPYDIGDRIQAGTLIGDVIDVRLFHTYLLEVGNWVDADQSTGRVVHLPNSVVFTQPIQNYTQGFPYIWHEIPILLTFESDWRRAKAILEALVQEESRDMSPQVARLIGRMKRNYPIRYEHLSPIVYTRIKDSGVLLTIRYLTEARKRRETAAELHELILDAFAAEPHVEFAYPTYRMFRANEAPAGPASAPGSLLSPPTAAEEEGAHDL